MTPFSPPARERALHAALVVLVRHGGGLAADDAAGRIRDADTQGIVDTLLRRVTLIDPAEADATRRQLDRLLAEWHEWADEAEERGQALYYRPHGRQHLSLLKDFGATGSGWETLHSMRNVDRQCDVEVLGARR